MTARVAAISTLFAAGLAAFGHPPVRQPGRVEAQVFDRPERLAQLRRQTDEGSPTEPGGLPGRSDRLEDSRPTTRGVLKSQKRGGPDKAPDSKSKAEDRAKKDQR